MTKFKVFEAKTLQEIVESMNDFSLNPSIEELHINVAPVYNQDTKMYGIILSYWER